MTEAKQQFVKKYIKELTDAINDYLSFDPTNQADNKLAENMLADTIIETVNVFSHELPKIGDGVLLRSNSILRDAKSVLGILELYLLENEGTYPKGGLKSSNTRKPSKIFISHRSTDKKVADILENFLSSCGISYENIFCSSLPGNDVKLKISSEIKENLKASILNIVILSNDYYRSSYCQNEAGIIWFVDVDKIIIALPEIDETLMEGFLDNEYKIRRLDNRNDLTAISDIVKKHFPDFISSNTKLNHNIDRVIEQFNEITKSRVVLLPATTNDKNEIEKKIFRKQTEKRNSSVEDMIIVGFSDSEILLILYILDLKRKILHTGLNSKLEINMIKKWEEKNQLNDYLSYHYNNVLAKFLKSKYIEPIFDANGKMAMYSIKDTFLESISNLGHAAREKIQIVIEENRFIVS